MSNHREGNRTVLCRGPEIIKRSNLYFKNKVNDHIQTAQTSTKATHYPHIAQFSKLENQNGDPGHPKNLTTFPMYSLQSYGENFIYKKT